MSDELFCCRDWRGRVNEETMNLFLGAVKIAHGDTSRVRRGNKKKKRRIGRIISSNVWDQ